MLMVPTRVPAPVVMVAGDAGEEGAEDAAAGEFAAPAGAVAALPVWAQAEITEKTAMARTDRIYLLVIGSLKLLGNTGSDEPRFR